MGYDMSSTLLVWHHVTMSPIKPSTVIVEDLDGLYYICHIKENFDEWSERAVRWAYINEDLMNEKTFDIDSVLDTLSQLSRMQEPTEFWNYILRNASTGFLSEIGNLYKDFSRRSEDYQRFFSRIQVPRLDIDGQPVSWEHRCDGEVFHEEHRTES